MDKFYNIKDKIENYESPLEVDKAWEGLVLKQENLTLKKNLRTRNIYLAVISSTILLLALLWALNRFSSKNKLSVKSETTNEIASLQENDIAENKQSSKVLNETVLNTKQENEEKPGDEELAIKENTANTANEPNKQMIQNEPGKNTHTPKLDNSEVINKATQPENEPGSIELKNKQIKTTTLRKKHTKIENGAQRNIIDASSKTLLVSETTEPVKIDEQAVQEKSNYGNPEQQNTLSVEAKNSILNVTTKTIDGLTSKKQAEGTQTVATKNTESEHLKTFESKLVNKTPSVKTNEIAKIPAIQKSIESNSLAFNLKDKPPYTFLLKEKYKKNFVLAELFGQGGYASINYGRVLLNSSFGQTFVQAGISIDPHKLGNGSEIDIPLHVPISLNQTFAIKKQHTLLIGLGLTLAIDIIKNYPDNAAPFLNAKLGYQYQKTNSNWFYKLEVLPYVEGGNIIQRNNLSNNNWGLWGGVGIGWRF